MLGRCTSTLCDSICSCSDHLMDENFSSLRVTDFLGHAPAAKPTVARPLAIDLGSVSAAASDSGTSDVPDTLSIGFAADAAWKRYVQ